MKYGPQTPFCQDAIKCLFVQKDTLYPRSLQRPLIMRGYRDKPALAEKLRRGAKQLFVLFRCVLRRGGRVVEGARLESV